MVTCLDGVVPATPSLPRFTYQSPNGVVRQCPGELDVYPIPAHAEVYVSGATGAMLQLIDMMGRVVRVQLISDCDATLLLTNVVPGVYIVRTGRDSHRLVVQ